MTGLLIPRSEITEELTSLGLSNVRSDAWSAAVTLHIVSYSNKNLPREPMISISTHLSYPNTSC